MQMSMLREAPVSLEQKRDDEGNIVVHADVANGKCQHTFPPTSRVSKALEVMDIRDLVERMSGGHFFVIDGTLIDFRYSDYNGFVHTDDSIKQLADSVGVTEASKMPRNLRLQQTSRQYILGSKWSEHDIQVPGYQQGGEFNSELHYTWNPFHRNVKTAFMLTRLICENGMMGLNPILNANIPLINRWQEHLNIASRQIQNKVDGVVRGRLSQMGTQRATVGELGLVARHAAKRLERNNGSKSERERLVNIRRAADPVHHLHDVYRSDVFEDQRMAAQLPGHLSVFDLYNMGTELRSHTNENDSSSTNALDRFVNSLLFDRNDPLDHLSREMLPAASSFSDPDAAFFGQMA